MPPTDLSTKRIVVTGAGGRLGSRMVQRFAAAGAHIEALVTSEEEAGRVPDVSGGPGSANVFLADVTRESSVDECFRSIQAKGGHVDALVHTVGMWAGGPLLETTQDDWDLMMRVNLTSTFLCFREACRLMQRHGGTIIGISSRQGADRGVEWQSAYSATKAGVVRLVESLAAEFSESGVRCHAIAPSTILFDEEGEGVQASDIIELAAFLIGGGGALSGATIRAYGC